MHSYILQKRSITNIFQLAHKLTFCWIASLHVSNQCNGRDGEDTGDPEKVTDKCIHCTSCKDKYKT